MRKAKQSKAKFGSLLFHAMHWCRSLEDVDQQVEPWSQLRWPEKFAAIVFVGFKDDLRNWTGVPLKKNGFVWSHAAHF